MLAKVPHGFLSWPMLAIYIFQSIASWSHSYRCVLRVCKPRIKACWHVPNTPKRCLLCLLWRQHVDWNQSHVRACCIHPKGLPCHPAVDPSLLVWDVKSIEPAQSLGVSQRPWLEELLDCCKSKPPCRRELIWADWSKSLVVLPLQLARGRFLSISAPCRFQPYNTTQSSGNFWTRMEETLQLLNHYFVIIHLNTSSQNIPNIHSHNP